MLERIKSDPVLSRFLIPRCEDEGICVSFDSGISAHDYIIIKVDNYYNSLGMSKTPPSPDCLIVLKCRDNGYSLTLVELKGVGNSKGFELANLVGKFRTCLDDFISIRFKDLLFKDYKDVKLYFVSEIDVYKRDIGLKMDLLINTRIHYNGKSYLIRPYMPTPSIKRCY